MSVDALHDDSPSRDGSRRLIRFGRLGMPENMAFFIGWRDLWEAFGRSVTGGAEPIEDTFLRLATQWRVAVGSLSNPTAIRDAPGFRELVALRDQALPFIMKELERDPFYWFEVLTEIAGVDPTPVEDAGNIDAMTAAWTQWYASRHDH